MRILTSLLEDKITEHTAVTVGKFDGMHQGHELLARKILAQKEQGLASVVVSFDMSPRIVLGEQESGSLVTNQEKQVLLEQLGVDYLILCPFRDEIMHMEPEEFIEILTQRFGMRYMAVGTDFSFGYRGRGNVPLLRQLAPKLGFVLDVEEKIRDDHRDISSTYIREEIRKGNIGKVNQLLGYPYFVCGTIEHGKHLGSRLGFPTINIIPPGEKILPLYGVYVTEVTIGKDRYRGVSNVGKKPTIRGERLPGVETHLLDFQGDLYGENAKVSFLAYLRPEKRFDSVEELRQQIDRDRQRAAAYFASAVTDDDDITKSYKSVTK